VKYTQIALLLAISALAIPAWADEQGGQLLSLIAKQSPSICTVKAMLKTEMKFGGQAQDSESKITVAGVIVDPDGIVMISNIPLSPSRAMEMLGGGAGAEGMNMKATASGFKVIFEREEKEYDAFLAATDTKLDLAFVKVEGLSDRKLPAVDFSAASDLVIGQQVAAVARLQKGYDYAPYVQTARVTGEIAKPRKAWMLEGGISELGLPVYSMTGQVVGVLSTISAAGKEEGDDSASFSMFMRMMGGGGMKMGGTFVVPGAPIKGVIELAKQRAVTLAAERAAKKKDAVAATAAPKKPVATAPASPPAVKPKKP